MKIFPEKILQNEKLYILLIAIVAVAVISPVLIYGLPYGYDLPHHYQCAMTYYESIMTGDFYPSWSLNRNFGFGGMETRLYPPVSHYALAVFYLAVGDWQIATFLTLSVFTFIGGIGVYLWAREYMPAGQAVFAGCIYNLLPYHLTQIYNTFFYAEFIGSCVLPFTFLFISRVCRRGKTSDVIGLAVSFAVLILTHLPLTVIGAICFTVYGLSLLKREKIISQIFKLAAGSFLGLAASSFFWIKVVQEKDWMAKTQIYPDPWLDYRLHFLLTPIQTFEGDLHETIFNLSLLYYDLMLLCAVVLALFCTLPFLIARLKTPQFMKGVWLVFALSVFLAVPFSRIVWDNFPLLQEVQFPWRWLAIVSLAASVLSAGFLNHLVEWFKNNKRPIALIVCGAILAVVTFSVKQIMLQSPFIEKERISSVMQENADKKGFTFWWTIWAKKEALENKEKVSAENRNVEIAKWTATEKEFQISEGEPEKIRIALYYHPNWKASVNGIPAETNPDPTGAISISIPDKNTRIKLNFEETSAVNIGRWISAAVWICFCFFILTTLFKNKLFSLTRSTSHKKKTDIWNLLSKVYELSEKKWAFLIIPGVSLLVILPMILLGVFNGGDLYQHIQLAGTFKDSIANGDFHPSWGGGENSGYGSNGIRFYPPVIPFTLGLFKVITGNWHTAHWIVFLLFTIIGSVGTYLWAKEFLPSSRAIWAGVFFIIMPYHLIEIHNASMYAEFAGVSVITFSFLFVTRICRYGKFADVLGLAIVYGFLIITHLPSSVIGSFSLLIYSLLILPKGKYFSTIAKLSSAVSIGVIASSFYWFKMAFERDWLRLTKFWHDQHFDYNINFLLTSPWIDARQLWFFNLLLLSMLILIIGCAFIFYHNYKAENGKYIRGIFILFFFSVFMTTILSKPLWAVLPFLHEVQFPWRWITISSVTAPILIAVAIAKLREFDTNSFSLQTKIKAFSSFVAVLFITIYGLIWVGYQLNNIPTGSYDNWANEKAEDMGAEWFWTPKTRKEAFAIHDKILSGDRRSEIILWNSEERLFKISEGSLTDVRIATLYYPYWKASVNGSEVELKTSPDGAILIPVSDNQSEIRLWFEEPTRVKTAIYVSEIVWLLLSFAGIIVYFKFPRKTESG